MAKFLSCLILYIVSMLPTSAALAQQATENQSAVVLVYHRFGENDVPSTNVRLDQFDAQINLLTRGGYHFIALPDLIETLKTGGTLPDKTISITVDDAYASVATEGWPRLKAAGIPLTIFVSTDPVDRKSSRYLSWEQLRQLKREGVTIAHHTASHLHMVDSSETEVISDIERASKRFAEELGEVPKILAYPYGEYSLALKKQIKAMGFDAAFAQYSSVIHINSDRYELPRFPVNERYGNMERFKLISQAKAIAIEDITPQGPIVQESGNPPVYGFTVKERYANLSVLACYPSHLGKGADIHIIGNKRVEIRFDKPFTFGRNRINCTMPAGGGRWYWLGKFFYRQGGKLD